jgi:phosphoribosylanthranilate isomerase
VTLVKFCGLTREADVEVAAELADLVGFVRHRPSPRYVTLARARELAARACRTQPVLVHRWQTRPDRLDRAWHQAESFGDWSGPNDRILVVRADPRRPAKFATQVPDVRAVLVDAHVRGQGGGTGRSVDLGWFEEFRAVCPWPVLLAGGLRPGDVAEVVRRVRPFAVDVSSGIESAPGVKDPSLMRAFAEAVRGA